MTRTENKTTVLVAAIFSSLLLLIHVECLFPHADLYDVKQYELTSDPGEPLYLSPYIAAGNITEARKAAYVTPFAGNITSYSGFLTINEAYNSNLFFWFFVNEKGARNAPLLLWLQGGPGDSSLFALFESNGPYYVSENGVVESRRKHSWTEDFNVVYIDNPVGAGFSFTDSYYGYSGTVEEAAANLYAALEQFFTLFPEFRENELFLTGESYAGKYIPTLANVIHEANLNSTFVINLKGLYVGCGFIDPINQLYYADYLYHTGVVDGETRESILYLEKAARDNIRKDNYYRAQFYLSRIALHAYWAGYFPPIDVRNTGPNHEDGSSHERVSKFIQSPDARKAIHVGALPFQGKEKVALHFRANIFRSASHYLPKLLAGNYRILLYSGQFDMLIPHVQFDRVISSLRWDEAESFSKVERDNWYVGEELAGYEKVTSNFRYVMVRNASHLINKCQPKWMLDLLKSFVLETKSS